MKFRITYKPSTDADSKQITRDADSYQAMLVDIIAEFEGTQCEALNIENISIQSMEYYEWVDASDLTSNFAASVLRHFYCREGFLQDDEVEVNGGDLVDAVAEAADRHGLTPSRFIEEREVKENAR